MPQMVATKPSDWTYTTIYASGLDDARSSHGTILFYAGLPPFGGDLHDNGASHTLDTDVAHSMHVPTVSQERRRIHQLTSFCVFALETVVP